MGQQQILLIVLSVILVGIAVSVGITIFRAYTITTNQDAMVLDITNIAAMAYQHRFKPEQLGGGEGDYQSFIDNFESIVPLGLRNNANGTYELDMDDSDSETIVIIGTSKTVEDATIKATYNLNLQLQGVMDLEGWED